YLGVFDRLNIANGGGWKSFNAGATWTKMTGGFVAPQRGAVAADGTFYVTFPQFNASVAPSPVAPASNGGVFKASRTATALTNITPPDTTGIGYSALAVDPTVGSSTLYVGQLDAVGSFRLNFWASTNGVSSGRCLTVRLPATAWQSRLLPIHSWALGRLRLTL